MTILAMGDSTTAGTPGFQSPVESPPDGSGDQCSQYAYWLMQAHPEWRVLNRGVNGERADQIRARLPRYLRGSDPTRGSDPNAIVLIAGVNDIYQGRDAPAVTHQLEAMYESARAARIPLVAGTILPYNTATADQNARMHDVNGWILEYAVRHAASVVFCDTRLALSAPGNIDALGSSPDELHPSVDGYRLMAIALEPAIRRALTLGTAHLR